MTHENHLPSELLQIIFNDVKDTSALRALCLVCKRYSQVAQSILYKRVVSSEDTRQILLFLRTIFQQTHLAETVKELRFESGASQGRDDPRGDDDESQALEKALCHKLTERLNYPGNEGLVQRLIELFDTNKLDCLQALCLAFLPCLERWRWVVPKGKGPLDDSSIEVFSAVRCLLKSSTRPVSPVQLDEEGTHRSYRGHSSTLLTSMLSNLRHVELDFTRMDLVHPEPFVKAVYGLPQLSSIRFLRLGHEIELSNESELFGTFGPEPETSAVPNLIFGQASFDVQKMRRMVRGSTGLKTLHYSPSGRDMTVDVNNPRFCTLEDFQDALAPHHHILEALVLDYSALNWQSKFIHRVPNVHSWVNLGFSSHLVAHYVEKQYDEDTNLPRPIDLHLFTMLQTLRCDEFSLLAERDRSETVNNLDIMRTLTEVLQQEPFRLSDLLPRTLDQIIIDAASDASLSQVDGIVLRRSAKHTVLQTLIFNFLDQEVSEGCHLRFAMDAQCSSISPYEIGYRIGERGPEGVEYDISPSALRARGCVDWDMFIRGDVVASASSTQAAS